MEIHDILIWLVILIELVLCITVLIVLLRVLRGIQINVNVHNDPVPVLPPEVSPGIAEVQAQLDNLEKERRKGEQQLVDLIGTINQFMTGGTDDAKQ